MKIRILSLLTILILMACKDPAPTPPILDMGPWHFVMDLGEAELTINTAIFREDDGYVLLIKNADEEIKADEFEKKGDSLFIKIPAFETEFRARFTDDSIVGLMQDFSRGADYTIPFYGVPGEKPCEGKTEMDFSGRWAAYFGEQKAGEGPYPPNAIGIFEQTGSKITGTFLTETGDYRYLEGCVTAEGFTLNTFDGSHAFLFTAKPSADGGIAGTFYSGSHYQEPWSAVRNDTFSLRSADALTYLNPGYDRLAFSFPDLNGDSVSLTDGRFDGKAVIVQIMGSWCPNCMDESRLYADWYRKYQGQGLEIVGLAFERHEDFDKAATAVSRLADRLDIQYPLLIAGTASKTEAAEKLPMLNHVLSFPTSIFIDKKGVVRKIHTGFNGPGTGTYYDEFVEEYEALIEEMLGE